MLKSAISASLLAITLCACSPSGDEAKQKTPSAPKNQSVAAPKMQTAKAPSQREIGNRIEVLMSVQHYDRPQSDKELDAARKPADVLQFSGINEGDYVVEMEAGRGYYTEIMSRIVGAKGSVIMQNPQFFDRFVTPEVLDARMGADGKRLANARLTKTNFDALAAADNSADLVTWILGPHEVFYFPEGVGSLGDPEKSYKEIFRVLKPGGHFLALDHVAAPGTPESSGGDTHRIAPATVRARAEAAGLVFVKSSDVLSNKADDHTLNVFDPKIRRQTDRFLHLYTKPKN